MSNIHNDQPEFNLKERIEKQMVSDFENTLERNFEVAKRYLEINKDGTVHVFYKNEMVGRQRIALYLIGKVYADYSGHSDTKAATNQELQNQLGAKPGSVRAWTKELRDDNVIDTNKKSGKSYHKINPNSIEPVLTKIENTLGK